MGKTSRLDALENRMEEIMAEEKGSTLNEETSYSGAKLKRKKKDNWQRADLPGT